MPYKNHLDLVIAALPDSIDHAKFLALAPEALRENQPRLAAACVLENCAELDWNAYNIAYPDVCESGIDPCGHFLEHGIFEGRRLFAITSQEKAPLISLVITIYDAEIFLKKCLDSAFGQTLKEIEIIMVDDASRDGSAAIARGYAKMDSRGSLLELPANMSQHMGRKYGVARARGKYIMFMDSDDFLAPNACEIAYGEISSGFDCVDYNISVIDLANSSPATMQNLDRHYNSAPKGIVTGRYRIFEEVFIHKRLTANIWNKIFRTDHCKAAFSKMEDGYFPGAQDLYEFITIASQFRNLKKITNKLYFHGFGLGMSNPITTVQNPRFFELPGDVMPPIKRMIHTVGLNRFLPQIEDLVLNWSTEKLLNFVPAEQILEYLRVMARQYGASRLISGLAERLEGKPWRVVKLLLRHFEKRFSPPPRNDSLVIIWPGCKTSEDFEFLKILEKKLERLNIVVRWILDSTCADMVDGIPNNVSFFSNIQDLDKCRLTIRLQSLYCAIKMSNPGFTLYLPQKEELAVWDLLILSIFDTPLLLDLQNDFKIFFQAGQPGQMQRSMELAKCADLVFCHSRLAELWLRVWGVEAHSLGPPPQARVSHYGERNILVSDCPQCGEAMIKRYLQVFKCLRQRSACGLLNFLVDCQDNPSLDNLTRIVEESGLAEYCVFYDKQNDSPAALYNSSLLLSFQETPVDSEILYRAISSGLYVCLSVALYPAFGEYDEILWVDEHDVPQVCDTIARMTQGEKWPIVDKIIDSYTKALYGCLKAYGTYTPWKPVEKEAYERLIRHHGSI